jgi:chromosome segregation ATPase
LTGRALWDLEAEVESLRDELDSETERKQHAHTLLDELEAEVGRLREQLDAARQALEQIANPEYTLSNGVAYTRNREACTDLARAALGVVEGGD